MSEMRGKTYEGDEIAIAYDTGRCIHAAECVRGLPGVFDTARRPWIDPDGAPPDEAAEVIGRCPSGALHYLRRDGGPAEEPDRPTTVHRAADGRLVVRGDLRIADASGTEDTETRATLCGCGRSGHQPFCDHSGPCAG